MDNDSNSQGPANAAKQAGSSSADTVRIDPSASAALEEAIRSARLGVKSPSPGTSSAQTVAPTPRIGGLGRAALALLLVGAGWTAASVASLADREAIGRLQAETARSQDLLARLGEDLSALRNTVVAFKDVERTASTSVASDRTKLAETVERLTAGLQEPGRKISALESRLDRMENQILAALAGLNTKPATAAAAPATEAAARDEAPVPKPVKAEPIDGWVLREVYNGAALVENRNRRLYEVMPGGVLPGVGRIEGIERRGTRWVVVTDRGLIGAYR